MKKVVGIIVGVILVAAVGVYGYLQFAKDKTSYITIDINPSVQLALNEDEEVTEAIALNDDADIVLSNLDLVGLTVDDATEKVINSATETGYIDEFGEDNEVTVTAYSEDEEVRTEIENKVIEKAKNVLDGRKIYSEVVSGLMTDALKEEAEELGVSNGKMLQIEKAVKLDSSLVKEDLVDLSMQEIQTKIKDTVDRRYEEKTSNREKFQELIQERKEIKQQQTEARKNHMIEEIKEANKDRLKLVSEADQAKMIKDLINEKKQSIIESASRKKPAGGNNNNSGAGRGNNQ